MIKPRWLLVSIASYALMMLTCPSPSNAWICANACCRSTKSDKKRQKQRCRHLQFTGGHGDDVVRQWSLHKLDGNNILVGEVAAHPHVACRALAGQLDGLKLGLDAVSVGRCWCAVCYRGTCRSAGSSDRRCLDDRVGRALVCAGRMEDCFADSWPLALASRPQQLPMLQGVQERSTDRLVPSAGLAAHMRGGCD